MTEATEINRPAMAAQAAAALLSVRNIEVVYDKVILVLRGLSLEVPKGAIVALLGANGAGKSTTLKVDLYRMKVAGATDAPLNDLVKNGGIKLDKVKTIDLPRKPEWLGW